MLTRDPAGLYFDNMTQENILEKLSVACDLGWRHADGVAVSTPFRLIR